MGSGGGVAAWLVLACTLLVSATGQSLEAAVRGSDIIPDVIDAVSSSCSANISISFEGVGPIEDGQLLAPPEAAVVPNITITSASGAPFTLVTVDPDAPDPANPIRRNILHYLVTNVLADEAVSEGTEVTPWAGPRPPSGIHRYVFLAYEQPDQELLEVEDPVAAANNSRANFDARAFASQYGLGEPCGVAWFLSQP